MNQLEILNSPVFLKDEKNAGTVTKAKVNKNNDFSARLNSRLHNDDDAAAGYNADKTAKGRTAPGDSEEAVQAKGLDAEKTAGYQDMSTEDKKMPEHQEAGSISQETAEQEGASQAQAAISPVAVSIPLTAGFLNIDAVAENVILPGGTTAELSVSGNETVNSLFADAEAAAERSELKTGISVVTVAKETNPEIPMPMNVKNAGVLAAQETTAVDFTGSKITGQMDDDLYKAPAADKNVSNAQESGEKNGIRYKVYGEEHPTGEKTPAVPENSEVKKIMNIEAKRSEFQRFKEHNDGGNGKNDAFSNAKPAAPEADTRNLLFAQRSDSRWNMESVRSFALTEAQANYASETAPEDLFDQMVKKFDIMMKQNLSEIKLQLHPEYLGKMMIKVVMEEGALIAKFYTENNQVKALIENNLAMLKQNFEAQGIKVEKTEVNVQVNADSNNNQDARNQQQQADERQDSHKNDYSVINLDQYHWPEEKTEPESLRIYPYEWGSYDEAADAGVNMESINYLI
ncbi:MAG: flagellar hook-length control protein FliK [Syntrophomonadaceae bacterium]|jgi:flagellar hook-length control protein FliK|nr:flagellar hook-length control protein FliK [Syntrophomonadaceae bacterium]